MGEVKGPHVNPGEFYRWKVSRWLRTLHLHPQKKLEVSA